MKYKIFGTTVALIGLLLVAKYELHLIGLVLILAGFLLAIIKGMKPE